MAAFQSRLDKVFGGLGAASWSVSGTDVERQEWRREDESDEEEEEGAPSPSSCKGQAKRFKRGDAMEEDDDTDQTMMFEVEGMVGMDSTLDHEDEEDEYDQVAAGTMGTGNKLYMRHRFEAEPGDDPSSLPTNLGELRRQPRDVRAFHEAAACRLAEDAKAAKMSGTADLFKPKPSPEIGSINVPVLKVDGKRKDASGEVPPEKRVKFADGTKSSDPPPKPPLPPDHVRHPHKYTHYYLDWNEEANVVSNANAWRSTMDAVDRLKENSDDKDVKEPVTFIPRSSGKKPSSPSVRQPDPKVKLDCVEDDATGVEEAVGATTTSKLPGKSYRARAVDCD